MKPPGSEWNIAARSRHCSRTGKPFREGDAFYTLLFLQDGVFTREDLSESAYKNLDDGVAPFSFWKSRFEEPEDETEDDPLPPNNAETLLRELLATGPAQGMENACYILALMLERKRTLRQMDARESGETRYLVYEHVKTGEVFMVADPELRLAEVECVQREVSEVLENRFATPRTHA